MTFTRILFLFFSSLFLCSCVSSRSEVTGRDSQHTLERSRVVDTISLIDTIRVELRGDTLFHERVRYRDRILTRIDTLLRVDTLTLVQREMAPARASQTSKLWGYRLILLVLLLGLLAKVLYKICKGLSIIK